MVRTMAVIARTTKGYTTSRNTDKAAPFNRQLGVYENVAALFCVPLHCIAFDCDGEGARTP